MNRKRLLLAVLTGALALSLVYAFWAMPRQEKAPPRAQAPSPAAKARAKGKAVKAAPQAERLQLGLLNQEPQPFPGAKRDIFRFSGGGTTAVALPVVLAPPVVEAPPPPPPPPPPPTPEELLRGAASRLTFLGFLEKGGQRTVFLSGDSNLYLVKAGDRFGKDKGLLAKEITDKHLVIGWAQGAETVRVDLIENEALKPTILSSGAVSGSPGQRAQSSGARPGGAGFPPRRMLPPRPPAQPVATPEEVEQDVPAEEGQEQPVQEEVQPPGDGVKLEELLKRRLQGGEGNGTAQ